MGTERKTMGKRQLKPIDVKGRHDVWFYEGSKGLEVVVERRGHDDTTIFVLPWRAIRAAVERKDAKAQETST